MPRRRRDRQGALFCAMQQLKGERGGCSPQANKGKQSDPALQHRGLSTGRVLLPPRRGGNQPVSTSPKGFIHDGGGPANREVRSGVWCGGDNSTGSQVVVVVMQAVQAWWNSSPQKRRFPGRGWRGCGGGWSVTDFGSRTKREAEREKAARSNAVCQRIQGSVCPGTCIRPARLWYPSSSRNGPEGEKKKKKNADHAMQG